MRERDIEKILTEEVKREGGRAYKWTSPGNAGVPDRIVIFPNRKPRSSTSVWTVWITGDT